MARAEVGMVEHCGLWSLRLVLRAEAANRAETREALHSTNAQPSGEAVTAVRAGVYMLGSSAKNEASGIQKHTSRGTSTWPKAVVAKVGACNIIAKHVSAVVTTYTHM